MWRIFCEITYTYIYWKISLKKFETESYNKSCDPKSGKMLIFSYLLRNKGFSTFWIIFSTKLGWLVGFQWVNAILWQWCHVMSCHVMSCHVMSWFISSMYLLENPIWSIRFPVGTCHTLTVLSKLEVTIHLASELKAMSVTKSRLNIMVMWVFKPSREG